MLYILVFQSYYYMSAILAEMPPLPLLLCQAYLKLSLSLADIIVQTLLLLLQLQHLTFHLHSISEGRGGSTYSVNPNCKGLLYY